MSSYEKVGGKNDKGKWVVALGFAALAVIIILVLVGAFNAPDAAGTVTAGAEASVPSNGSGAIPSIYKIRLEGKPGKAIQIARMYIKDANDNPVALTTDGTNWYDKTQVWADDREDARPDNIIEEYDPNDTCQNDEYELHTTAKDRGVWTTMANDDYRDTRIRMKKGEVNFANFKTAEAVDLTGATVHVLGRYHCKHKWPQHGEAFTIKVTNVNTGEVATVEVPKLRYDEEGYRIQHKETLKFVYV